MNLPRMDRCDKEAHSDTAAPSRCKSVMLTNKQYAAVLVADVDQSGTSGEDLGDLNPQFTEVE